MRSTAYVTARPRYGLMDVIGLLFRELGLMVLVFLLVFALGAVAVMTLKKTYTAHASLAVGVGQEYVPPPRLGQATTEQPQPPTVTEIATTEAGIIGSTEVKRRAVRALGVRTFQGDRPATGTAEAQEAAAIRIVDQSLAIATTSASPVIQLSYDSRDASLSARVLNAIIDQYLIYRREVFQDRSTDAIGEQRRLIEDELADADMAYNDFLATNDIGDFAAAKASLAATYQSVFTDRMLVQAQLDQTDRRLRTLVEQLQATPGEIVLQQDLNVAAQDLILQARNERAQLLARYTETSQPVRDIDARIAELEANVARGGTVGAREVRTGPNAIWTEIETTRITTQAERDSLAARLAVLDRQLGQLRERQARMTRLESENATLASGREVLTASVRDIQQREIQQRAENGLLRAGADNVTVFERASPPLRGKSLKAPLLAIIFLFAAFTALCVGLLRIFSRRAFVTPASAGRTLELPVLAVAPAKAA